MLKNFLRNFATGSSIYQKQLLGPKLAGVWAMAASKKIWPPIYFCNRWS